MNASQQKQSPAAVPPGSNTETASGSNNVMPADKEMEHLWRYFALHAQQRISIFNFFVVLSGVISAAIGGALEANRPLTTFVVILGLLLPLLSFVFWRLDQRNSDLVKISERALRRSEESCLPDYARIFVRETLAGTNAAPAEDRFTQTRWTFRRSFNLVFIVMGATGTLASCFSVYQWFYEPVAKVAGSQAAETSSKADAASAGLPATQIRLAPSTAWSQTMESAQTKARAETNNVTAKP